MTIYFLQPFPETRPLSSEEVHVFNEEGGGIFIINEVYKNKEDALYYFGERLGVTLSFEGGEVVPDYYFADTQLTNAPGYPKFDTHVYVRRQPAPLSRDQNRATARSFDNRLISNPPTSVSGAASSVSLIHPTCRASAG